MLCKWYSYFCLNRKFTTETRGCQQGVLCVGVWSVYFSPNFDYFSLHSLYYSLYKEWRYIFMALTDWIIKGSKWSPPSKSFIFSGGYHTLQGDNSLKSVESLDHMMFLCRFQASRWSKPQRKASMWLMNLHCTFRQTHLEWATRECQQLGALGMYQHFNTQNRHGPNPEYNCAILVLVTPRMSTRLVWKSGKNKFPN